jgi:hypothetical protein
MFKMPELKSIATYRRAMTPREHVLFAFFFGLFGVAKAFDLAGHHPGRNLVFPVALLLFCVSEILAAVKAKKRFRNEASTQSIAG